MAANVGNLDLEIGCAKDWRITLISKATGARLVLTANDKIVLSCKATVTDPAGLFVRRNTAAGGSDAEIALIDGPNGVIDVKIIEANSALLVNGGLHPFDLRYELASDTKDRCALIGTFRGVRTAGDAIP
jgi:hypothetical protein